MAYRDMGRRWLVAPVVAALVLAPLAAQWQPLQVQSRLVQIPVTITSGPGAPVDGLEAADFVLLDNGQPQKIVVDTLGTGVAPISLMVAVQTSGISASVLEKVRHVGGMIQPLITGERGCAGVVTFAEDVQWIQECTGNADFIEGAFQRLRPQDPRSGRMLDAVQEAVKRLAARPKTRRVLLLISESRDRGSETDLETAAKLCEEASVTVYSFTYSAFKTGFASKTAPITRIPMGGRRSSAGRFEPTSPPVYDRQARSTPPEQRVDVLAALEELHRIDKTNTTQVLAFRTGGTTFPFTRQKGLEDVISKLGAELHSQYVLSFVPDSATAGYHRVEVKVNKSGAMDLRARPGYWAGPVTP
jgi:VWFA-related protein